MQNAKDAHQAAHLELERARRSHLDKPPTNPLVHVPYDPPRFGIEDMMLRSVLQRLLLNSPGDTDSVVCTVRDLLSG